MTKPVIDNEALAELERDLSTCDSAVFPITVEMATALCQTVRAAWAESKEWERQARLNQKAYGDEMIKNTALREQLGQAIKDRDYWRGRATEASKAAEKWYHERY